MPCAISPDHDMIGTCVHSKTCNTKRMVRTGRGEQLGGGFIMLVGQIYGGPNGTTISERSNHVKIYLQKSLLYWKRNNLHEDNNTLSSICGPCFIPYFNCCIYTLKASLLLYCCVSKQTLSIKFLRCEY